MKITCPNCATSYMVPDDYIGPQGRAVRCSSCGKTWHAEQNPESATEDAPAPEVEDTAQEQSEEQSQDDIDALFDSPAVDEEQSQDDIDALFDMPSDGEEQSQDDIDSLFDTPSDDGEDQESIDSLFDAPSSSQTEQVADADPFAGSAEMPSTETPGPDAREKRDSPFVVRGDGEAAAFAPVVDLMDAAAFEAQKAAARGKDVESSVKRRLRGRPKHKRDAPSAKVQTEWAVGSIAFAASLILVAALYFAPDFWVKRFPDLSSFYKAIGIEVNIIGVEIDVVDVQLRQVRGSPVLSVATELVNMTPEAVILPSVEFSVLGNERSELYSWVIEPDQVGLGPGERKHIETSIAAPAQARYLALRAFHK